jgi:hypothetical protein
LARKILLITVTLYLLVAFNVSLILILAYAVPLDKQVNLSPNRLDVHDAQVFSVDSTIYVFWMDLILGNDDIYFKKSTDGGASFGDTINLSNSFNTHSTLPRLTLLNENVYTAWTEGPFNDGEVYYRRSTDGGASFGETVNLSNDTGDSGRPELRVSAPNLFIVWQNQAVKGDDIFFKRSTNGGASFGDTINISNNKGNPMEPEFSVTNASNVFIVWQNQASNSKAIDILLKNSTDGGASFGDAINLSSTIGNSTEPDIASSNDGGVFAVWTDDTNGKKQVLFTSVT